jgi:hypothetical protein
MATERLTYAQIGERLSVSAEAARAIVKRHRLPRSRSNDDKALAAIDLQEIKHKPLPARPPRSHRAVTGRSATWSPHSKRGLPNWKPSSSSNNSVR